MGGSHASSSSSPPVHSLENLHPACQKCKTRKKKCDRVQPACGNCNRNGSECVYELPSSDSQQRLLIARLMEENERLQAGKAELEKKLSDVIASSSSHHAVMNPTLLQPVMEAPAKSLPIPSSFAELIVTQVMNAQVDTGNAVQSLVASVAQQIGMPLREVMDRPGSSPLVYAFEFPTLASLPDRDLADAMVERYFACGNCYQPLLDPETVRQDLAAVYGTTPGSRSILELQIGPDIRIFRIFMVFGIGSNLLPYSVTNGRCDGRALRAWATSHFASALRSDEIVCLVAITLYCLFAITDSATMDPYQSVRIAATLAIGLGFHIDREDLPLGQREMRKRIFWSIYGMDRSISFTLTRSLAIDERIISTSLPSAVPELSSEHTDYMTSIEVLRQTVYLRWLQGRVLRDVYLQPPTEDPEDTSSRIRNDIDEWYEKLPRSAAQPPQVHPYLEANYHLLLIRLYSPSPSMRRTPASSMTVLRNSAYKLMEIYGSNDTGYRTQRNHVTLAHISFACVALVYTLIENESTPANLKLVSWRRRALSQIDSAERLLAGFCSQSTDGVPNLVAFAKLTSEVKNKMRDIPAEVSQPAWANQGPAGDPLAPERHDSALANLFDVDMGDPTSTMPWSWDNWSNYMVHAAMPTVDLTGHTAEMERFLAEFDTITPPNHNSDPC